MKSLVIGGNGFIGTNLVEELLLADHDVRVFDRYPSRFKEANPNVQYVIGDFANHGEVADLVKGVDVVFHLAYASLPHTSNEDPIYDVRSNVVDTIQLLQECRAAEVRKVVFISSGGTVYGIPKQTPIPEDHPTDPICSYGITKLAIEKYLQLFQRLWGLEYVIARISNPYGEQQNPYAKQGAVGVFLGNVSQGKPITIWGDGKVVRDYIYIRDAVRALVAAAAYEPGAGGHRLFNIGAGSGSSLNELVDAIRSVVVDKPVEVKYTPGRPEDVPANVLDISRAREVLGWQPETDLRAGLARTWQWMKTLSLV